MTLVRRLQLAGCGLHLADQIALVCVPLVAALAFEASAQVIGVLVACQSLAHLVGTLPFGLVVDRVESRRVVVASALISLLGFCGTAAGVWLGSLFWFGLWVTVAGFGIVAFVLAVLSILPKAVPAHALARANARIELPRAASSFAVPLAVGLVISGATLDWVFVVAALGALAGLALALGLPGFETAAPARRGLLGELVEGAAFVIGHKLLLAILLCALFWNFAFSALLVAMVPLITDVYRIEPGSFGIAMAAFGLAAVTGSWLAARCADRISPSLILLAGPGSSVLAALALFAIPAGGPAAAVSAAFFLLGFCPSMWLIAQNSVRPLVSPGHLLGRVNAVIQTAIYGVRPLGALLGGAVVGATSPRAGLLLVAAAYLLSFAAAALSGLRTIRSYSDLKAPAVG